MRGGLRTALVALALVVPVMAQADPKDDARKRFVEGVELARDGDFRGAIQRFTEADAIYRHPATTYNIAYAYQELGEYEEAISWYRILLIQAPARAEEIDAAIAGLEQKLAARRVVVQPVEVAGGGGLNRAELERLRAIASELETLAAKVAERVPEGETGEEPGGGGSVAGEGQGEGDVDTPPVLDGAGSEGFLGDAYERVVVTASRYGQDPLDSPSTISVITADDIRASAATDVTDVLRRVVGVDVMSMSAGQPEISIRGFNRELNNKVLVLIDGRSVYWDFIGTTQWGTLPIVLEEIERIEVIRGPGSAVYGANAVTGVVNIITKTPGETPETLARFEAGAPGYIRGVAYTSGRAGETSYRFSAGYDQHGRWSKPQDLADGTAQVTVLDNQELARTSVKAHGRIDRAFGEQGVLSLSGGYVNGQAELYNLGVLGNFARDTVNTYARVDGSVGPVHGRVFWNRVAGTTGPWAATPDTSRRLLAEGFIAQTVDAELETFAEFETGDVVHRINGGVGYRFKTVGDFSYIPGTIRENHFNAFINEEATVGSLTLVASLRADRHPLIDLSRTLSPRGAAILRVGEDRSVRVTGGTAFRVPTLVESYMDITIPTDNDGVFVRDFGSRTLNPERIVTVEAGFHDESTLYHQADVAVYYNRVSDLIFLGPVQPTYAPYDPVLRGFVAGETGWVNLGDVYQGVGVELDGEIYPVDGVDIFGNVAVQRLLRDTPGQDLAVDGSSSLVKANAGVQWRSPWRLDLSMAGHFTSAQTWSLREFDDAGDIQLVENSIPARFILQAKAAVRPFPDDDLELSLSGWNLAALASDLRFREHPKGQLVGARVFGAISYRF